MAVLQGLGFVVAVAVASILVFRRRPMGSRTRLVAVAIAGGLSLLYAWQGGTSEPGRLILAVATIAVLAAGVWAVSRGAGAEPPQ